MSPRCGRAMARRDGQQVEIVIAEHRGGGVAERHDFAQHGERIGTAVDEIADEPQAIVGRAEKPMRSSSSQNSAWQPWMSPIA